ncbi:hypothetical protein GTY58_37440 [Streptomyces sp. SID5469]|nr:hypothetical protein [Streptomyces sp. SID5469]
MFRCAVLDLRPWCLEPGAAELSAASDHASKVTTLVDPPPGLGDRAGLCYLAGLRERGRGRGWL